MAGRIAHRVPATFGPRMTTIKKVKSQAMLCTELSSPASALGCKSGHMWSPKCGRPPSLPGGESTFVRFYKCRRRPVLLPGVARLAATLGAHIPKHKFPSWLAHHASAGLLDNAVWGECVVESSRKKGRGEKPREGWYLPAPCFHTTQLDTIVHCHRQM